MPEEHASDHKATFRFYEELNDFLPKKQRKKAVPYSFFGQPSVKDSIEAIGPPHTEVDLILVNGISVDFDYLLCDGDRVSVYPIFERLDISPVVRLRPAPLTGTKRVRRAFSSVRIRCASRFGRPTHPHLRQ